MFYLVFLFVGDDIIRYGSDIHTNVYFSSNSNVFTHLPIRSSFPSYHHPCCTLTYTSARDQLCVLPICHVSFQLVQTRQPHVVHVTGRPDCTQLSSITSSASNMTPSTSHLSDPCRSIQLFIKSIRNTTISIHIDSTLSVSDLKHLIYAHDGISPCDLRLMHHGRELRDDALLSDLDVDGDTITCLLRVLGGNLYHQIPLYWWLDSVVVMKMVELVKRVESVMC